MNVRCVLATDVCLKLRGLHYLWLLLAAVLVKVDGAQSLQSGWIEGRASQEDVRSYSRLTARP